MDRATATAAPTTITLGGKELKMSPLTDKEIGILDRWVRARHIQVARESLEGLSEEDKEMTMSIALQQASAMTFMSGPGAAVISTIDGWAQIMWCGIHKNHPEITPDELKGMLLDPVNLKTERIEWERLNMAEESKTTGKKPDAKKKKKERKTVRKSKRKNR